VVNFFAINATKAPAKNSRKSSLKMKIKECSASLNPQNIFDKNQQYPNAA